MTTTNTSTNDLELYSSQELIKEIMNRHTFQGIIIHTECDCKEQRWDGKRNFSLRWNDNLEREEVSAILQQMVSIL